MKRLRHRQILTKFTVSSSPFSNDWSIVGQSWKIINGIGHVLISNDLSYGMLNWTLDYSSEQPSLYVCHQIAFNFCQQPISANFQQGSLTSNSGALSEVPGTPWSREESLYIDLKKVTPALFLLLGREKALMCRLDWIGQPRDCPPI